MKKRGVIGIDIGGTKSLYALFDAKFRVIEEIKLKTSAHKGKAFFKDGLSDAVTALVATARKRGLVLAGVGAGIAGSVSTRGDTLVRCPGIPFLEGFPIRSRLARLTGARAMVINDVQAGLYGEYRLGAAKGARHAIGVFIGTGIGGALIIEGKLYAGADGQAGDIGNFMLHASGLLTGAPSGGTLDQFASRSAIAGDAAVLAAKHCAPSLLRTVGTDVRNIGSRDLAGAIAAGDKAVDALIRSRAHTIGIVLSNLVDFLNPDVILLGGGLVEDMPRLIREEVKKAIRKHGSPVAVKHLKVVVATLKNHAVTTGAAKLAVESIPA